VVSWVGGCDSAVLCEKYGRAFYKHPRDGALIISAHRGTDWWKNPSTAVLAAYGIYRKYPETIYFKPSGSEDETKLLKNVVFDIQYGGTPKEGMSREQLLITAACAQLALEPAYSEGFSRSCNEMMNMGIPVIQGPNAEHIYANEILTKHLIVRDPSDVQEVTEKGLALLENERLWNEVSAECIRFSSQFNVEQEVNTLIEVLERK
jgi:glycosyltransferase involved in cell wall biosynthesis